MAASALWAVLLSGINPAPAESARTEGNVVAFVYDSGTDALLKADAGNLFRSGDGGKNWQELAVPLARGGGITAVAASPAAKGVAYVTGMGLGVLETTDAGKTWVERNEGLPSRDVTAVAAHSTQPETVYAVVRDHGVYRSQDSGKSWRLMDRGVQGGIRQLVHSDMAGSMQTGWLFAATDKGVRRSMDCFCLWQDAGKLGAGVRGVTYDPKQPEDVYAATEKGLFRSTDGGENWIAIQSPARAPVAISFAGSGTLYAMDRDGTLFSSADRGSTWNQVNA